MFKLSTTGKMMNAALVTYAAGAAVRAHRGENPTEGIGQVLLMIFVGFGGLFFVAAALLAAFIFA
jgi:hypothetical protein